MREYAGYIYAVSLNHDIYPTGQEPVRSQQNNGDVVFLTFNRFLPIGMIVDDGYFPCRQRNLFKVYSSVILLTLRIFLPAGLSAKKPV